MRISGETVLNLAPILDRFDQIESRLTAIEAMQGRLAQMAMAPVVDTRLIDNQLAEIKKSVPVMLDAMFAQQVNTLRDKLQTETKQALETFEALLEKRLSSRIATIEKALIDQSGIITALSERAIESDANMQRLISAVEKLCERTELRPANVGFEGQLNEAIKQDTGFRPKIVKEDDADAHRHRRKLTLL
jgi:hypothetical protein